ncbi:hypothetical protein NGUA03_04603 [Salmonella enterica]|nr:hypothetical protein NGUA03_04602 [Salmonella enterica]GAR09412.1 hypothetical protein NGUA03_04603 [Salmonella enterica]
MQKASSIARLFSDDLTAAVATVGSDVVTQVVFSRSYVYTLAGDCVECDTGFSHGMSGMGWFFVW